MILKKSIIAIVGLLNVDIIDNIGYVGFKIRVKSRERLRFGA